MAMEPDLIEAALAAATSGVPIEPPPPSSECWELPVCVARVDVRRAPVPPRHPLSRSIATLPTLCSGDKVPSPPRQPSSCPPRAAP